MAERILVYQFLSKILNLIIKNSIKNRINRYIPTLQNSEKDLIWTRFSINKIDKFFYGNIGFLGKAQNFNETFVWE